MTQHIVTQTGGTLLDNIVDFIIPPYIVLFLNQVLYRNFFLIINYWSFVHIFSGIIFYFIHPKGFILWLILNIVFEVIEFVLALGGHPLFVEEFADIIWDILWGLIGFGLMYLIFWGKRRFK